MIELIRDRPTLWPGGFVANPTGTGILSFDASIREDHGAEWAVTSSTVESGATVTDHVQPMPIGLTVEVVLAQCPDRFVIPDPNRAKVLYEQILAIGATRVPFDFATTLRGYSSMVFTRISTIRSAESGDALVCSLAMRQIEIATVDQSQVLADAAIAMSLGQQNLGSLTPPTPAAQPLTSGVTLPVI